ncbi:hypothetical protein ACFSX9_01545 [Flavobacterium ardleyense]|uniref:Uncharacterized protein n=1 Tax=Flavobacterium ardleyense TaxID=2038737 RepID=A0ABW5Z3J9_9FLAO
MSEKSNGRIFQDDKFVFKDFDNLKIEKIIVVEVPETKSTCLVYIKVKNHNWHRYFLDIGFAVWENWNDETIDEDDSYDYIDKTSEFQLFNKSISKIYCEPIKNHCKVVIELDNDEKLVLQALNPNDYESEVEFIKLEKVFCVFDYWDMTILSGVANFKNKPYFFETNFDEQKDDYNAEYELTELKKEVFIAVQENWEYWLNWLKQNKIQHPNHYAERRKATRFEELQNEYDKEEIERAEKYYQNELILKYFIEHNLKKIKSKGKFEGELNGINTFVQWK